MSDTFIRSGLLTKLQHVYVCVFHETSSGKSILFKFNRNDMINNNMNVKQNPVLMAVCTAADMDAIHL